MQKITPAEIKFIDGQPFSSQFDDVYFNSEGALEESEYVFIEGCDLKSQLTTHKTLNIVETGFGTGLNFLQTWRHFDKYADMSQTLNYFSIEKHPLKLKDLKHALQQFPTLNTKALLSAYPRLYPGIHILRFSNSRIKLILYFGDILTALKEIHGPIHCWYLDGFAPSKNPQMWPAELFNVMQTQSIPSSRVSTFTAKSSIRHALADHGFTASKRAGFGKKREMLVGTCSKPKSHPNPKPWFHINKPKPYRKKIAIIGAGIAGSSTAYAISQRGHECAVFEKHQIASGASGNAAGLLAPALQKGYQKPQEFILSAFYYSRALALKLCDKLKATGALYYPCENYQPLTWLQGALNSLLEKQQDQVYFRDAITLSPQNYVKSLLKNPNITVLCQQGVSHIDADISGVKLKHNEQISFFDCVVVTNGADALKLLPELNSWLFPVKGQVTAFKKTQDIANNHALCFGHYCLPSLDNCLQWCGASFIPEASNHCTVHENQQNLAVLESYCQKNLVAAEARSSIRLCSRDHLPVIGPLPNFADYNKLYPDLQHGKPGKNYPTASYIPNVFVNIGHGSKGLATAPLCGELLAQIIQGEPLMPISWYELLHPARFWLRDQKKRLNTKSKSQPPP